MFNACIFVFREINSKLCRLIAYFDMQATSVK